MKYLYHAKELKCGNQQTLLCNLEKNQRKTYTTANNCTHKRFIKLNATQCS